MAALPGNDVCRSRTANGDEVVEMNGWHWGAVFGLTGAVTGLLGAAPRSALAAPPAMPPSDYRPAEAAPAAWQTFAQQLGSRFQEQLAADDVAQELQEALAARAKAGNASTNTLTAQAWILPSGQIERVEFERIDALLAARLRVLLSRVNVGAPPSDMLQPVHVRLLLRPKDQPGAGR
jgi:hypothetical protein